MSDDTKPHYRKQSPEDPFFMSLDIDPSILEAIGEPASVSGGRYSGALRLLDEWLAEPGDHDERVLPLLQAFLRENPLRMGEE